LTEGQGTKLKDQGTRQKDKGERIEDRIKYLAFIPAPRSFFLGVYFSMNFEIILFHAEAKRGKGLT
jgi:hypothetical protein